jgi:hypothetical protein
MNSQADLSDDLSDLSDLVPQLKAVELPKGLSQVTIEMFYATGFDHLQNGEFAKAKKVFLWLLTYLPGEARFWAGLAHSLMGLNEHDVASGLFSVACLLDENNAGYQLSLSRAYLGCGLKQMSRLSLRVAQLNAEENTAGQLIREQASALLALIENDAATPA